MTEPSRAKSRAALRLVLATARSSRPSIDRLQLIPFRAERGQLLDFVLRASAVMTLGEVRLQLGRSPRPDASTASELDRFLVRDGEHGALLGLHGLEKQLLDVVDDADLFHLPQQCRRTSARGKSNDAIDRAAIAPTCA